MNDRPAGSDANEIPPLGGDQGPVLVIADQVAIALRGPAWAAGFSALERSHRVRVVGPVAGHFEGLVDEARDLAATAILAAGGEEARRAGRAVATRLGLPLAIESDPAVWTNSRLVPGKPLT